MMVVLGDPESRSDSVGARRRANLFGRDDPLALQDGVELVGFQVLDDVGRPGWPADLNAVDPGGRTQTEVHAKIAP